MGQLSPSARIFTPGASSLAEARSTKPAGQRKNAQAVSPRRDWRVRHSPWSWLSAANELLPFGPTTCRTHREDGPIATRHSHDGYSAANCSRRKISQVATPISRSGFPVSFASELTGKTRQPRFATWRTSSARIDGQLLGEDVKAAEGELKCSEKNRSMFIVVSGKQNGPTLRGLWGDER